MSLGIARHPPLLHLPVPGSYKSCIPEPLRCQIQQHSFLTRKRIRRHFSKSLRKIGGCQTDGRYLKLKYLLDLERLQRRWAEESFRVRSPGSAADITIHVASESGVSWSCDGSEVQVGGCAGGSRGGVRWGDAEASPGCVPRRAASTSATSPTSPTSASSRRAGRAALWRTASSPSPRRTTGCW